MSKAIKGLASVRGLVVAAIVLAAALGLHLLLSAPAAMASEPDADGDLVPDSVEEAIGTDKDDADSDYDGKDDGEELWVMGTDPMDPDTDGDALSDYDDEHPLDGGADQDGRITISRTFESNLSPETLVGTTTFEGINVMVHSGQFLWSEHVDTGGTVLKGAGIYFLYRSGVTYNGPSGKGWFLSIDNFVTEEPDDDVVVNLLGQEGTFTESQGSYSAPAGWPYTLTKDTQNGVFELTAIRGGFTREFDTTTGLETAQKDRFGNTQTVTRDQNGNILSVTTAEGIVLDFDIYSGTKRIESITAPRNGTYTRIYNYYGGLARSQRFDDSEIQYRQIHGSATADLNNNMTLILDPMGRKLVENRYDTGDRISKQLRGDDEFTFSYDTQNDKTTVFDLAGNKREWYFGSPVPTKLIVYSNRNVNPSDPTSWTTTFTHNTNRLRTKTVFPRGNSVVNTWNSNYCLTKKRLKKDDTQADNDTNDLVWTYTYGSTYYQLKNSTDPRGNTTQRTLDSKERVTKITHPTITHTDPDVTIEDTFTWNPNGQLATAVDGEGVVTKYDYFTTGAKKNLLWKVTKDYGTGKLNLTTTYDYNTSRQRTSSTDPDNNTWTYTIDDMGRVTKSTSPSSLDYETEFTYNTAGQLTQRDVENVDGDGLRVTANPWWTTTYAYNSLGERTSVTEEIDSTTTRTTSFTPPVSG